VSSRPVDEVIRAEAVFKGEAESNVFYSSKIPERLDSFISFS